MCWGYQYDQGNESHSRIETKEKVRQSEPPKTYESHLNSEAYVILKDEKHQRMDSSKSRRAFVAKEKGAFPVPRYIVIIFRFYNYFALNYAI